MEAVVTLICNFSYIFLLPKYKKIIHPPRQVAIYASICLHPPPFIDLVPLLLYSYRKNASYNRKYFVIDFKEFQRSHTVI